MIGQHSFTTALPIGAVALAAPEKITIHLAGDSTMAEKLESKRMLVSPP